jgi:hypothetical protein
LAPIASSLLIIENHLWPRTITDNSFFFFFFFDFRKDFTPPSGAFWRFLKNWQYLALPDD